MKNLYALLLSALLIGAGSGDACAYEIWAQSGVSDTYIQVTPDGTVTSASNPASTTINRSASVIDAANGSTIPLAASGVFTGGWTSTTNYTQVAISVLTDQVATLQIQFSNNGSSVSHTHSYIVTANSGKTVQVQPHGSYYRINFVNSGVPETSLSLISVLKPIPSPGTILEARDVPTGSDDAALTKSIITGSAVDGSGYKDVATTTDGGLVVNQNTQVDAANSTTTNLASGATFLGPWVPDLNYTAVQYIVNADQNLTVSVEQSSDGTNNDLSDLFEYFNSLGGDGNTVQLVGSYYRIRIVNVGAATTTHLRLQTIKVPFLQSLPRRLSPEGNLSVAVKTIQDDNGFSPYFTPFGEQVSVPLYKLVGSVFNGSTLDANIWTAASGVGGSITQASGVVAISTGVTANNSVSLQTVLNGRFVAGQPNKYRMVLQMPDTGVANNVRRWGGFSATDGAYFQSSGVGATSSLSVCVMKAGVSTCTPSGSLNGYEGSTFTMDTNAHVYEIEPIPQAVYFLIDGELIHTAPSTTAFYSTSWTSTLDLPVRFDNTNTNGSTTNVTMNAFAGVALRLGIADAQPQTFYQAGTTTGVQIKLGAGNVRKAVVSNVSNTATITLYDGTSTAGRVIWSSGGMGAQTQPFSLDFDKGPFSNGLFLVISGAAANLYVTYD